MKPSKRSRRRHRKHFRRHAPQGASPGTIAVDPAAPRPVVRLVGYGPDEVTEVVVHDLAQVRAHLGKHAVLWVDVDALGDAGIIEGLGEIFQLHRLALEDVVNTHQRPKVEMYDDRLYIVAHLVTLGEQLETEQVSLFLGPGWVVSFQEKPGDCYELVRKRIRDNVGRLRKAGADYLAYALLDVIVDAYFPVLEQYGERLDMLEEEMLAGAAGNGVEHVHALKRDLLLVRRLIWPQREAVSLLAREDQRHVTHATRVYLRDCYDHCVQLVDLIEMFRELASDLRDFHMTTVSNRINDTMRVLTVMGTLFLFPTLIASIYGMNFATEVSAWNMPELHWVWGYPFALGLMLLSAAGMVGFFAWMGWIGSKQDA